MRRIIISLFVVCCMIAACNITKKTASVPESSKLEGEWELSYISGPRIAFDGLYPNNKPSISFDTKTNRVNGNSSCNSFNGKLNVDANKISFTEPMAMTRMACLDGNGETVFMETLYKINSYSIAEDGKTLNFMMGDIAMMRFTKK